MRSSTGRLVVELLALIGLDLALGDADETVALLLDLGDLLGLLGLETLEIGSRAHRASMSRSASRSSSFTDVMIEDAK